MYSTAKDLLRIPAKLQTLFWIGVIWPSHFTPALLPPLKKCNLISCLFSSVGLPHVNYSDKAVQNDKGFWYLKGVASKSNTETPYVIISSLFYSIKLILFKLNVSDMCRYLPMFQTSAKILNDFYLQPNMKLRQLFPEIRFSWMTH